MPSTSSFWYLASPYDKFPPDRLSAFYAAIANASILAQAGVKVYSPIVHNHPIDNLIGRQSHDFWLSFDEPFMRVSQGIIVCKLATWEESKGIEYEIECFNEMRKPVIYMEPGEVPLVFKEST